LIAIVNQGRVAEHKPTLSGANQTLPALYEIYSQNPSVFNDITSGNNGMYTAAQGYDLVTGLGTPVADRLVPALVNWNPVSLTPGSVQTGTVGVAYRQTFTASGGTGHTHVFLTPTWATFPLGLAISPKDNELDITGTPTLSGTFTFNVTATDPFGATTTQSYTLTINPENVTNQVSLSESGLVYSRATQLFGGTITLTNTGTAAIGSTLEVVLTGLPSGVTLANANGTTADGNPYFLVTLPSDTLVPGQSIKFTILFSNPKKMSFQYGASIFDV